MNLWDELSAPFPPDAISWRVGSTNKEKTKAMALAYIDARDVMDRLDKVVGPANWQNKYSHANGKTVCDLAIRVDGEWVWKADGAGDTDVEAEKGAFSDALKRAAVRFGIGRYLYGIKSPWVEIREQGRSYVIAESEYKKLEALLRADGGFTKEPTKDETREEFQQLCKLINNCTTSDELKSFKAASLERARKLNGDLRANLNTSYTEKLEELLGKERQAA